MASLPRDGQSRDLKVFMLGPWVPWFCIGAGGVQKGHFNAVFLKKRGQDPRPKCPVLYVSSNQVNPVGEQSTNDMFSFMLRPESVGGKA